MNRSGADASVRAGPGSAFTHKRERERPTKASAQSKAIRRTS